MLRNSPLLAGNPQLQQQVCTVLQIILREYYGQLFCMACVYVLILLLLSAEDDVAKSVFISKKKHPVIVKYLGDLKTRISTSTSCQIKVHFSSQTSKSLMKYNLLRFQVSGGLVVFFTEHDYKVSTSFINESKRYE